MPTKPPTWGHEPVLDVEPQPEGPQRVVELEYGVNLTGNEFLHNTCVSVGSKQVGKTNGAGERWFL